MKFSVVKFIQKHPRSVLIMAVLGVSSFYLLRWFNPVKVTTPTKPTVTSEITAEVSGQLRASKEVFLSIKKGGRLDEIRAQEGSLVEEGQILGIVDITHRKASVQSALSSFSLASNDLSRLRSLYRSGAVPRQELDDAVSQYDVKKAALTQARQDLEDGLIRSPIKGKLAVFAFSIGDILPDGARVAVIEDTSQYFVIGRLNSGQPPGQAQGQALSKKMPAEIRFHSLEGTENKLSEAISGTVLPLAPSPTGEVDVRLEFSTLPEGVSVRQAVRAELKISTRS